jgi:REP element-mobilizing transposase RayT
MQNAYFYIMPVKRTIPYSEGIFSITFTCAGWLPLIEKVNGYDIIYSWFNYLTNKGHYITGYVIMPNHVHVMIAFRKSDQPINTIIGNGKRFMAYEIIKRLKNNNEKALLEQLQGKVEPTRKANAKQHNVWELSFDWKHCESEAFIEQKLFYFHNNPNKGKWNLCASPVDYLHSSAKSYATGEQYIFEITNYTSLTDIDLTSARG